MRQKVLFTNGSDDFLLIITDAPHEAIEEYCKYHNQMVAKGRHFETFAPLKALYYVKELLNSEVDDKEDLELIGYDVCYDFSKYSVFFETKEGFRTVVLTAGMLDEFEVISTNAPDSVIMANMQYICALEEEGAVIEEPYAIIKAMGYEIEVLGNHDNFTVETVSGVIDASFDFYDFYT